MEDILQIYINTTKIRIFLLKERAEKSIDQLSTEEFFDKLSESFNENSVALLVKHISGNMISRWTDFFTSDGEKDNRHRDTEFEEDGNTEMKWYMDRWDEAWEIFKNVLDQLTTDDLSRKIIIRGEELFVIDALQRQYGHYAEHIGQLIMISKHWKGNKWKTLSIVKGASKEFNKSMK